MYKSRRIKKNRKSTSKSKRQIQRQIYRKMRGGTTPLKVAILFGGRVLGYENVKDNLSNIMNTYNPTVFCSLNKKNKSEYIKEFCDFMKIDDEL